MPLYSRSFPFLVAVALFDRAATPWSSSVKHTRTQFMASEKKLKLGMCFKLFKLHCSLFVVVSLVTSPDGARRMTEISATTQLAGK